MYVLAQLSVPRTVGATNGDSDYLFFGIRGNRVSKTQVQRAVKAAAVEADVMERVEDRFHEKFTPHTYRTVFTEQSVRSPRFQATHPSNTNRSSRRLCRMQRWTQ